MIPEATRASSTRVLGRVEGAVILPSPGDAAERDASVLDGGEVGEVEELGDLGPVERVPLVPRDPEQGED